MLGAKVTDIKTDGGKRALDQKRFIMSGRLEALLSRRVCRVVQNAWKNRKSTRFVTFVCDVLIAIKC